MSENEKYINNLINSWEKEITPVHEFSDGVKLLKIKYTEKETKIMDIFRAILLSKEISLRVYEFTSIVIEFFSTNYAAWVLRRQCIDKIKEIELIKELNWLDEMMLLNQKNYQIWHHRKLLIDKMNDASNEKKLLDQVFSSQPKIFMLGHIEYG
jgi:protein farnesyltransferase/geranylgeranyltransferase type-1 subunit alpha